MSSATLIACPACEEEDDCSAVPRGGECTRDDDCVLALCQSACCGTLEPCNAPSVYRRTAIRDHDCLVAPGTPARGVCRAPTSCLCDTCEAPPLQARCVAGQCAARLFDGGTWDSGR